MRPSAISIYEYFNIMLKLCHISPSSIGLRGSFERNICVSPFKEIVILSPASFLLPKQISLGRAVSSVSFALIHQTEDKPFHGNDDLVLHASKGDIWGPFSTTKEKWRNVERQCKSLETLDYLQDSMTDWGSDANVVRPCKSLKNLDLFYLKMDGRSGGGPSLPGLCQQYQNVASSSPSSILKGVAIKVASSNWIDYLFVWGHYCIDTKKRF